MPQDTMLSTDPKHDGLRLEWEYKTPPSGPVWHCTVKRLTRDQHWKTVHVSSWTGVMLDLADSMAQEVQTAFFYGGAKDLVRAAARVVRRAKAHAVTHEVW